MRALAVTAAALLWALTSQAAQPEELRFEVARQSLTRTHCRMRVTAGGLDTDRYVTVPCTRDLLEARAVPPRAERRVQGRPARRMVVEETPLQPWAVDVDVATGRVLRREPLFFNAKEAAVFDPNPVAALNAPGLQDQNDSAAAIPPAAYRLVDLVRAEPAGPLRGPWAAIVDRQLPAVAPPDASGPLVFDREADGFEGVNAWFHIDRNQEYVRSLGFTGPRAVAPYAIEVDAHALSGTDNSLFLPSLTVYGTGALYFGTGGTDDAEDADLVIHEYGHALLEWIAPGTFSGGFASESRAFGEGFCDYWAYSAHRQVREASGRDPHCIADWDARCWLDAPSEGCAYAPGVDCLRRVDGTRTMADYVRSDSAGTEHVNGSIWSSALREIQTVLRAMHGDEAGRRMTDAMVLESIFGAPPAPTFTAMGRQLVEADRLLYGGTHLGPICAALSARGILTTCDATPRGELALYAGGGRGTAIPDNDPAGIVSTITVADSRPVERVLVRVDAEHPLRGDLRIELIAPDGTTVLLQQVSGDRDADVHATFGLDAVPAESLDVLRGRNGAGLWRLRVADLRPRDRGALISWRLMIRFAGDEPLATRPAGDLRTMLPVVAHTYGANETAFRSDVRIANPWGTQRSVMLVFTPSASDGAQSFAAVRMELAAGQTVALDDVVASVFQTAGSGSLEILGDVFVASRTYHRAEAGTLGQQVPPVRDTTKLGGEPLFVAALPEHGSRYNAGVTETAGGSGVVRIDYGSGPVDLDILPWSHLQLPIAATSARIAVVSGDARVGAYVSQVDPRGDAMFIPAASTRSGPGMAPAASASGVDGTHWRSDTWVATPEGALPATVPLEYVTAGEVVEAQVLTPVQLDAVGAAFGRPGTVGAIVETLPPELFVHSRISGAGTSQYVPLVDPLGPVLQNLPFVENGGGYRTNLGFVTLDGALAEVTVFDGEGNLVEQRLLGTDRGLAQLQIGSPVQGGRAVIRFLSGQGRAYSSVIDTATRDATLFLAE